jgi:hypothetical protein
MAPLFGLVSLLCGFWFLLGMPITAAVFAWQDRRSRKLSTGLLVAVVMLVVFYISAALIWRLGTADWNLSFLTTLEASVDSEKYGHKVEHRAEVIVVWLLVESTSTAVLAGVVTTASETLMGQAPT